MLRWGSLDHGRLQGVDRSTGVKPDSHSTLANICFATDLARRLEATGREVSSTSLHLAAISGSGFRRFLTTRLLGLVQRREPIPGVTAAANWPAENLSVAVSPRTAAVSGRYFTN